MTVVRELIGQEVPIVEIRVQVPVSVTVVMNVADGPVHSTPTGTDPVQALHVVESLGKSGFAPVRKLFSISLDGQGITKILPQA